MAVVIETTIGDLTVDLFTEERPIACLNFLKLCKLKYYNYNLFHTIEQGFIAQTGDPTGAGDGGSSIWGVVEGRHKRFFESENLPKIYHSIAGLVSLVSAGKNMVGSQFFFTLGVNLASLDGLHCVIGQVVEGHETLRKLNEAIVDENFRPYQDIRITHTVVLDDPYPDPRAFRIPSRSPSPSAERLKHGRIAADEDIDDTDGKSMEEIQEMLAEREAKARATILEIVGDIPNAEIAPPENVLFVCKLNPVTTDDDLEIIFSRFGKIKSCEVIRDSKSGDSLQYAFVEFEDQKSCEAAYFKMDNVLIDDRRIHVDFSQSVAKVKWRGKGRGVEGQKGRLDFNNLKETGKPQRHDKRSYGNTVDDRSHLSSEDRRKARENRHQAQRARENRERHRSRSRSGHRKDRGHEKADDQSHPRSRTERKELPSRRDNKHSRSRSKKNTKRNSRRSSSPGDRNLKRRSPEKRRSHNRSPIERKIKTTEMTTEHIKPRRGHESPVNSSNKIIIKSERDKRRCSRSKSKETTRRSSSENHKEPSSSHHSNTQKIGGEHTQIKLKVKSGQYSTDKKIRISREKNGRSYSGNKSRQDHDVKSSQRRTERFSNPNIKRRASRKSSSSSEDSSTDSESSGSSSDSSGTSSDTSSSSSSNSSSSSSTTSTSTIEDKNRRQSESSKEKQKTQSRKR